MTLAKNIINFTQIQSLTVRSSLPRNGARSSTTLGGFWMQVPTLDPWIGLFCMNIDGVDKFYVGEAGVCG
uniref:Uncharacterized protein n=1 Tax=Rhizophagus irregularis (strain DAOM 181602 / DAOM 197198 / MUCL 43194) TaxID=747089 RepID=U9T8H3_RHIID